MAHQGKTHPLHFTLRTLLAICALMFMALFGLSALLEWL